MLMQKQSIFQKASPDFLEVIHSLHKKLQPTFLIPTKFVSKEAAKSGAFFNTLCCLQCSKKQDFITFFCNSKIEALHGAIKIMRHHQSTKNCKIVLIFDIENSFNSFFSYLVPGVSCIDNYSLLKTKIKSPDVCGVIIHVTRANINKVDEILALCKHNNLLTAISFSNDLEEDLTHSVSIYSVEPDIFIYGESFTDYQIPFGCFSMSRKTYQPWNNIENYVIHSSTYSGNLLALTYLLTKKANQFHSIEIKEPRSFHEVIKMFGCFVNPRAALIYSAFNLVWNIQDAQGSWLTVRNRKNHLLPIFDCLGNSGCNLRGHNPSDFIDEVINSHDPTRDYISELEQTLHELTGLKHLIPAVSGANAVENALSIFLLTNLSSGKILTFKDNYSGKTLGALSVTEYSAYKDPFGPLYPDVVIFDPFQQDADKKLIDIVIQENISLVWFEVLQGDTLQEIPEEIINTLKSLQIKNKILIGVDEILTGCYRTGKFLMSDHFDLKPDIITLSKGLSDMSFPFACTLISETLYCKANLLNFERLSDLSAYFANSFGAHVALHALEKAEKDNFAENITTMGRSVKTELETLIKKKSMITEIYGRGLLLYLAPNENIFPINLIGKDLFGFIFSSYLAKHHAFLSFNCRLTPQLNMSQEDKECLIRSLEEGLASLGNVKLIILIISKFLQISIKNLKLKIIDFLRF